jgi:hypothetical protein
MVEPLRDPEFFARAFVEMGVPTWPNGFDIDAIKLHMDMSEANFAATPPTSSAIARMQRSAIGAGRGAG